MAINNILGSIAFVPRGDYSASATYNFLNFVKANNHWYLCILRGGITNLPPAATFVDNTQWAAFVESGDNNLATITENAAGLITIERKGLADFTFYDGHTIQKEGASALDHTDILEFKGTDLTVTNDGSTKTVIDVSAMDVKIATNASAISTNASDITNIEAKTDLIEIATTTVNLNTLSNELAAILAALEHSDTGSVSQVFNIPAADGSWKTSDFSTRTNVGISSTGVVTRSTNWVYDVHAEIYTPPILAYHNQTATVNETNFTYVTLGIVFSKARHSAYIDIFKKLDKDNYDGTDTSIPNPNSIYLENDSGARFTPYSAMSQASTDGVTIFKQTDPSPYTELYTLTIAIEAQFLEHYDNEQRFTIQVDDKGIRGFHAHSGDDTLNTAKIKAAIKANTEAIDVEREILNHYPGSSAVVAATDGQVLTKELVTVAGTKASGSFEIANVQQAGGSDSALLVVTYPDSSPLDDFPRITVPITIAASETPTQVAARIVASFEGSSEATVVKFRDGYAKDGVTFGGYVMTNSGAVITLTSDNEGSIYNAAISIYEGAGRFGVINNNPIAHGTGGPEPKVVFKSAGITQIADSASLVTLRGTGFSTGQTFSISGAAVTTPSVAAIAAQATITYPATSANVDYKVITGMISETDTDFMEQDLASDPSNFPLRLFIGSFDALATAVSDQTATEVRVRVSTTDTAGSARATSAAAQLNAFNGVTRLTAAGITTGAAYSLNCTVVADGANLIITSNTAGARTTLVDAETGGSTTMTLRQGADATTVALVQDHLYQVVSPTILADLTAGNRITVL